MDWFLIAELGGLLANLWMIGSVAVGLGLVIFVHELGHFLAAKACGVKCEKFYIGFDIPLRLGPIKLPSALCKFRWGETEYGVGVLPLGGYVKMLGQDDDPRNQAQENERIKLHTGRENSVEQGSQNDATSSSTAPAAREDALGQDTSDDFELDPRSFPAKPVWQRMIIISAGVAMNLVSAVVFGAVAYQMGVSYTPCLLGGTAPGDPAWVAGIEAGDKILQIGREGWFGQERHPSEHLRFDKDLMINVTLHGAEHPLYLLLREDHGTQKEVEITPSDRLGAERPATLGVRPASTTRLDAKMPYDAACGDEEGYSLLEGGDEIIAVEGQQLPRDPESGVIFEHHLERLLAPRLTKPVTLTVLRGRSGQTGDRAGEAVTTPDREAIQLDVTLPPNPLRKVGLIMEPGPIVGVREGTPAEEAGFRKGDVLVSVDGKGIGDPFTLAQRLLAKEAGKEVEFVVRRGADTETLRVRSESPEAYVDNFGPGSPVPLECLGIAFDVRNVVADVVTGSPADLAEMQAGDKVLEALFLVDGRISGEPIALVEEKRTGQTRDVPNWAYVHSVMNALPTAQVRLTYRRNGGTEPPVTLTPKASEQWYHASRRLNTTPFSSVRTASSWSESWSLGYRETTDSLKQIVVLLQRLFTGKISFFKNVGGPIMIAQAAGAEASKGIPRLLLFLTFLSANLAILNFLPIPALDGGHMLFLAAEGIRGKPVNERLQVALTLIGVGCLLSLMVVVFALDIQRLGLFNWIR